MIPMAKVNEIVEERSSELVKAANKERDDAVELANGTQSQLNEFVLADAFHKGGAQVKGLQEGIIDDIIDLAAAGKLKGVNFVRDGLKIKLLDDNEMPLMMPDGEGHMDIQHWLESKRETHARWFVPNQGGGPGPGIGGSAAAAAAANGKDVSKWTIQQKTAFVKEHGPEEWTKLVGASSAA